MSSIEEDSALARSSAGQFQLISAAYESGDEEKIEMALYRVVAVRRMLRSGFLDLIENESDD